MKLEESGSRRVGDLNFHYYHIYIYHMYISYVYIFDFIVELKNKIR